MSWNDIATSPDWRELVSFIGRWYCEPASAPWGHSEAEVCEAESRLGARLPPSVREWYLLVGGRLQPVQDSPVALGSLRSEDEQVALWTENQGVWQICTRLGDESEIVVTGDHNSSWSKFKVPTVLLGMVASETLMGAPGCGVFGPITTAASGGHLESVCEDEAAAIRNLPPLPYPDNPHFAEPVRGDNDTLIRLDESGFGWWATRTKAARASLEALLGPLESSE